MDAIAFQRKWIGSTLKERSASQSHFNDLCAVLDVPTPTDAGPTGDFYTFERGAEKAGGGDGWADVWYRGHFAWEYKGKRANLRDAYLQLLQYRDDLENPPLLIVSDLNIIEIHTNFTGTIKQVHTIDLATFAEPDNQAKLRRIFEDPDWFKPGVTRATVTQEAARRFGQIVIGMHQRGIEPSRAAHYLVQLLFCLFAEDVGLLPNRVFSRMVEFGTHQPARFLVQARELLEAMNTGGDAGYEVIPHFNGGLFREIDPVELTAGEIAILKDAAALDWSAVEPAIFGTLFERSLDPNKRSQLGAHYTGRHDIERVVDPVVMMPLRRRWDEVLAEADALKQQGDEAKTPRTRDNRRNEFAQKIAGFLEELAAVRILDPACGSGNFLYVALERLLSLEKEVITYRANAGFPLGFPLIDPRQVLGLEINEYAQELAQVAIWIGYLQWMIGNGFGWRQPVLDPLETIRLQDALLDFSDGKVSEAVWPEANFIIGNPPFLRRKELRRGLTYDYVDDLFAVFEGRVQRSSSFCCYWFEKARSHIEENNARRAGLLATENIRFSDSRMTLDRIKRSGDIFMAWSDQPWVLSGASVRIAIVGFDDGSEALRSLNGSHVPTINSDLTSTLNLSVATSLVENRGMCFMGLTPAGAFDLPGKTAREMLSAPININGRLNSDVIRPYFNGQDVTGRPRDQWIIDFGTSLPQSEAAMYERPFLHVQTHVRPNRMTNSRQAYREKWWIHAEARSGMRKALRHLNRYIVTVLVAKHRIFVWLDSAIAPANRLIVFAREDDYFFGVLHSRAHEVWSLRMGARHGVGNDPTYNNTTCFETFPLPWPPGKEPVDDPRVIAIGEAAAELDSLRRKWLDPEGAFEAELKKRTLTNLYNQRPTWLQNVHAALDRAVWAAYGWDDPDLATVPEDTILSRLLALNLERSGAGS